MDDFLTYAKNSNVLPDILSWHELVTSAADVSGFEESTNQGVGIYTVGQTFVSPLQADSGTKSTCRESNIPTQYNNNGWGYESMS